MMTFKQALKFIHEEVEVAVGLIDDWVNTETEAMYSLDNKPIGVTENCAEYSFVICFIITLFGTLLLKLNISTIGLIISDILVVWAFYYMELQQYKDSEKRTLRLIKSLIHHMETISNMSEVSGPDLDENVEGEICISGGYRVDANGNRILIPCGTYLYRDGALIRVGDSQTEPPDNSDSESLDL